MGNRTRPRLVFALSAVGLGIVVSALLSEAVLRVATPPELEMRMRELNPQSAKSGFRTDAEWPARMVRGVFEGFKPFSHFTMNSYEYSTTVNIDQWGGRVVAGPNDPGLLKGPLVPFMGDSFTFGMGVEDDETFVSLIDAHSSVRYVNLGVPGSALPNHLDTIEAMHADLSSPPVYVFCVFLANDLNDVIKYYTARRAPGEESGKSELRPLNPDLIDRLSALTFQQNVMMRLYALQFLRIKLLQLYNHFDSAPRMDAVFLVMRRDAAYRADARTYWRLAMERLADVSNRLQFKPVFVLIPDRHQVDERLRRARAAYYGLNPLDLDVMEPNVIVREQIDRFRIPYFDLYQCLNGRQNLYYVRDGHFTPAGHRAVASCIGRALNELIVGAVASSPSVYRKGRADRAPSAN